MICATIVVTKQSSFSGEFPQMNYFTPFLTKSVMKKIVYLFLLFFAFSGSAQKGKVSVAPENPFHPNNYFKVVRWRNIGPSRGGRSVASCGVVNDPLTYYMGTTGGGVWKTTDAGNTWFNISDGYFKTGSVGAVAVSESDPNVVYVGMGEHAPRGVMTSYGDGVYKSTDAGKTWTHLGLDLTRQIAGISVHPTNPDLVYVAAQGAIFGATEDRGVYKSADGGKTWKKVLYVDQNTGCVDLNMDMTNPRILYAAMWDYRRTPWEIRSGGPGSGLYKSTDGGETWKKIQKGLPKELGKMGVSLSRSNPDKVYALVESDTQKEEGGLFVSEDAGANWTRVSKDHRLTQRAWYYTEVFVDPQAENTVYVLNSPGLKSVDGGKTWTRISGTHGDYHHLWINPKNGQNMIVSNDGGAAISFNGSKTWSTQNNQPTAQFYRVNADNLFPYNVYGGQQDNTSVKIASRSTRGFSITDRDWSYSAGGESAFLAFDPDNPENVMGGSYQGTIEVLNTTSGEGRGVMIAPIQYQALAPKTMKYRFNWNAPIINSIHDHKIFYHAGNRLFKTSDLGRTWEVVSPDLTRHDTAKMGTSGVPFTNEGAGGENYGTISYVIESPHEAGVLYTGSDDGLVYVTKDGGKSWSNITPPSLGETLINSIEVSPHDKATAYVAATRYKFNDLAPAIYKTTDYGKTWTKITAGIPYGACTRVVREDDERKDLLFAGTETGLYISFDGGRQWQPFQSNLPVTPITDLKVHKGDLIASTAGRAFWILDDLEIVRQMNPEISKTALHVYKPEPAYRVSGGSLLDRIEPALEDSDVVVPNSVAGTNPPTGVVIYYQLPASIVKDSTITLDILDAGGKVVRSFTNKPDKKFQTFPGGPEEDPTLNAAPGLNRFVWNLRYASVPGVPTVFIEGSYAGRKAIPGAYQVRIRAAGQEQTAPFTILPDPRINATPADYAQQDKLAAGVEESTREIHFSVLRLRQVKKQVSDLISLLEDKPELKPLTDKGRNLIKKINTWEDELVQNKAQSNDDVINYENKLSADYIFLKGEIESNVPVVTKAQQERLAELDAIWQKDKSELQTILNDVAAFNQLCNQLKVQNIIVPANP
jgi:photosystem II stability/assembly factor-like uncharacterized protein